MYAYPAVACALTSFPFVTTVPNGGGALGALTICVLGLVTGLLVPIEGLAAVAVVGVETEPNQLLIYARYAATPNPPTNNNEDAPLDGLLFLVTLRLFLTLTRRFAI